MYAVQFDRFGPPEVLTLGTAPAPHPGPGEVRIAVKAAGVSPVDLALRAGLSPASQRISLPHIPGLDALEVRTGSTLLIDGAAGGVGSVAVQLAIARGARVIGTGRQQNRTFIAELGAIPVTYGPGLPGRVRALGIGRVEFALHIAGADALPELIAITGTAARVLTIADFTGPERRVRLSLGELGGQPDGRHGLPRAAALAGEGRFRIPVQHEFPMAQAAEAHAAAGQGPRQGKIALIQPFGAAIGPA